jgi:hypothetical protein
MMRRLGIQALCLCLGIASLTAGCFIPLHKPPKAGKPAAVTRFWVNHAYSPMLANRFRSRILIDGRLLPYTAARAGRVQTWTRVKPGWRTFTFSSYFAYVYSRTYPYTYTHREAYRCGTSTCYRYVTRTRYRTRYFTRRLGYCRRMVQVWLYNKATYRFYYDYVGPYTCGVRCQQTVRLPSGQYKMEACRIGRVGR